jgi:hypothetical protein
MYICTMYYYKVTTQYGLTKILLFMLRHRSVKVIRYVHVTHMLLLSSINIQRRTPYTRAQFPFLWYV